MWDVFDFVAAGLGSSFEHIILFVVVMGGIIFYAKDFKIGVALQFVLSGCLFIWFYSAGLNYVPSIVVFLMTFVILSFSLYATSKQTSLGGIA